MTNNECVALKLLLNSGSPRVHGLQHHLGADTARDQTVPSHDRVPRNLLTIAGGLRADGLRSLTLVLKLRNEAAILSSDLGPSASTAFIITFVLKLLEGSWCQATITALAILFNGLGAKASMAFSKSSWR